MCNFILIDTEETVGPVPDWLNERYDAWIEECREDARAILGMCRHLLTGREMQICEDILDESGDIDHASDTVEMLERLRLQYPREIAEWKNGRRPGQHEEESE